jgi:hypothetical protein
MHQFIQTAKQNRNALSQTTRGAKADRARQAQPCASGPLLAAQALGNQAMQSLLRARAIQAKLNISTPGDKYEQEADSVAETVMRMPEPRAVKELSAPRDTPPQIQRMCSECEEELQRQPLSGESGGAPAFEDQGSPETTSDVSHLMRAQVNALRGGGQPLPTSVRNFFEPRFRADLSHVRIHTDARAAESARAINAAAYTTGRDIVFGASRYAPERTEGQRLLAHELTHTIQQRAAGRGVAGLIQRAELNTGGPEGPRPRPPTSGPQCVAYCQEQYNRCVGSRHNIGCSEGLRACLERCNPRLPGLNS